MKLRLLGILFSASLLCSGSSRAQGKSAKLIDSLERKLKTQPEDSTKVKLLSNLSWKYSFTDLPKAKSYAQQGIAIAEKLKNFKLLGGIKSQMGLIAVDENHPEVGISYFEAAARDLEKAGYKNGIAVVKMNTGLAYSAMGKKKQALDYYFQAERLAVQIQDKGLLADCLSNISCIYQDTKNPDSALRFHQRSLKVRTEMKDTLGMGISLYNIGALYSNAGDYQKAIDNFTRSAKLFEAIGKEKNLITVYNSIAGADRRMGNIEGALKYNQMALQLAQKAGATGSLASIYSLMGLLNYQTKNFTKSKWAYKKSLYYADEGRNLEQACQSTVGLALLARENKNYKEAAGYYEKAIQLARSSGIERNKVLALGGLLDMKIKLEDTSGTKALLDEALQLAQKTKSNDQITKLLLDYATYENLVNHPQEAVKYYKRYVVMTDSVFNREVSEHFAETQTKYETKKKEKEITLLQKQKEISELKLQKKRYQFIAVLIVLLLLLILIIAYLRRQKLKRILEKQKAAIREIELKRKTILETENIERKRIAKDLHDELGSGLSKIVLSNELAKKHINGNAELNYSLHAIDNTLQELSGNMKALIWSLYNDNATLENLLVKMREFVGDFLEESDLNYSFDFPETVPEKALSKEMLRDIFLAFKEAVNNVVKYAEATTIELVATYLDDQLLIEITDNGVGMDVESRKNSGNGLKNMQERMERQQGSFKIISKPGEGTRILFEIPLPALSSDLVV